MKRTQRKDPPTFNRVNILRMMRGGIDEELKGIKDDIDLMLRERSAERAFEIVSIIPGFNLITFFIIILFHTNYPRGSLDQYFLSFFPKRYFIPIFF